MGGGTALGDGGDTFLEDGEHTVDDDGICGQIYAIFRYHVGNVVEELTDSRSEELRILVCLGNVDEGSEKGSNRHRINVSRKNELYNTYFPGSYYNFE